MKDNAFDRLLKIIGYQYDENLNEGRVSNVEFVEETCTLNIKLVFPNVVNVNSIISLNRELKNELVQQGTAKKVNVIYNYENFSISNDLLKDYYVYTLSLLTTKKVLYKALEQFSVKFTNGTIILTVGSEDDQEIISPLFEMIQKSFELLGLGFIKFEIEIDNNVKSINDIIEENRDRELKKLLINYRNSVYANRQITKPKVYRRTQRIDLLNGKICPIANIPSTESAMIDYKQINGDCNFLIEGVVASSGVTTTKTGYKIYQATLTEGNNSIIIKTFINEGKGMSLDFYTNDATKGKVLRVYGYGEYDQYSRDVVIKIKNIACLGTPEESKSSTDTAEIKRVELHAHSKMTFLDSVLPVEDYVKRATEYGHRAIALTDKNTVQGLGELLHAIKDQKSPILPIYGIEASMIDEKKYRAALSPADILLKDATFVVYDLETTGISVSYNEIIEIGARKVFRGKIIDEFSTLVNPKRKIPDDVSKLTNISNDQVRNAPFIEDVLPKFNEFIKGCVLVGHNVTFDNGFLYHNLKEQNLYTGVIPTIDTMQLARIRYNKILKKFGLEDLVKAFNVSLSGHHRASNDAIATTEIFIKMYNDLINDQIFNYNDINSCITDEAYKFSYPSHITMLAKNRVGLVNLNRLVSDAHVNHFHRGARFLKSVISEHREGLLIGSGCIHGEVFETALNKDYEDLLEIVSFYDYLEVQPVSVYSVLIEQKKDEMNEEKIKETINKIIRAGKEKGIMVVATGDVHELEPNDRIFRNIIYDKPLIGGGIHELNGVENLPDMHYRTTSEMLNEFSFLDKDLAYEIVVTNTNKIADMIEKYDLFPKNLFSPGDDFMANFGVPSAREDMKRITYEVAKSMYGDPLPAIVSERVEKELNSIIKHEYCSIYYIAYLLVKHSKEAGYVVGSRGSIGSSLVATFMHITEVNSLVPHYVCPKCHFTAFSYTQEQIEKYKPSKEELELQDILHQYDSGLDLPPHKCPICGEVMMGDGCSIPFETFLGFKGDKVPDIDLNFSGEYQSRAHDFCREIFGKDYTYRGGTIGTIAERTAENYIRDYYAKRGKLLRSCEIKLLTSKITGIKRQTGQHPGGIVVVPKGVDINEVTPVQYPADDLTNEWKTTHIDYHKFESNLLKLDILGHDDPTMIRYLMNFVDSSPSEFPFNSVEDIPLSDPNVLKMFSSIDILGVTSEKAKSNIASTGLPEFGTTLTKGMLEDIRPTNISDLIRISGLSHGTDVWAGTAKEYFLGTRGNVGRIPINKLICCRDDIMETLIKKGVPAADAFSIMERVRKGKGLTIENEELMKTYNVEEWYIDCCKRIKYLFPKAHATAYVIMALRIAWFKLYKPLCYYSGFFTKRAAAFEVETMQGGYEAVAKRIDELSKYGSYDSDEDEDTTKSAKTNDEKGAKKYKELLRTLQVALEMLARGFTFQGVNINKSHATDFIIDGDSLIIPFVAIDSFGSNTAKSLVQRRGNDPFTSILDASRRGHISNSLSEKLFQLGAFGSLPREDEIGLFKFLKDDKND